MSRFGDTFCNAGAQAVFASSPSLADAPLLAQTAVAAAGSGVFRALIMPLDTVKTIRQVDGPRGREVLRAKMAALGARRTLWAGAAGAAGAHAASFFPWFAVHNALQARVPRAARADDGTATGFALYAARAAGIGLAASSVSDTASNALHVLKARALCMLHAATCCECSLRVR